MKIVVDRCLRRSFKVDDVLEIQSDLGMLDHLCRNIATELLNGIDSLTPPIFFAGNITDFTRRAMTDAFVEIIDIEFVYGVLPLDPFRLAVITSIEGHKRGLSEDEIIEEIARYRIPSDWYEKESKKSRVG